MHEIAYAEGILDVALRVSNGQHVRRIQVRIGDFYAIVADSLQFAFDLAGQDSAAAGAHLDVVSVPGDTFQVDALQLDAGWLRRPEPDDTLSDVAREHMHEHVLEA